MQLKAENISFKYKCGRYILNDVNISVESGEVVGLTAPSGVGKTTLAKILAGFEKAERGKVFIDGEVCSFAGYNPIQLIFQHPEKAVNPKWKMKKALEEVGDFPKDLMNEMGIQSGWLNRWPSELSGGELQRFCVLRVLNENTRFIIADEMTTMLDTITQAQIWKTVLKYAKEHNIGIVVISHEKDLLDRICDRIVDLDGNNKDSILTKI